MSAKKNRTKPIRRRRPSSRQLKKRALYRRIISFSILGILIILGAMLIFQPSQEPDSTPDSTPAEIALAAERGRQMAEEALAMPEGSMARQEAILDIRARETSLRLDGYPTAADALAAAADSVLTPHILPD